MATAVKRQQPVIEKIAGLLRASFPGLVVVELDCPPGGRRITGVVTWEGFRDLSQLERQNRLWEALRKSLTEAEQRAIGMLLTFTPEELASIDAG